MIKYLFSPKKYLLLYGILLFSNTLYGFEFLDDFELRDGLYLQNDSKEFSMHIDVRMQTRYTNIDNSDELKINRSRLKVGGKLGVNWLDYYTEYDFVNNVVLDFWVAPKVSEALHFRIGQYKVPYNRERFDSSGKQQFAERSIVTPTFTLDRQVGVTAMGRIFKEELFDSSYAIGLFLGTGRGGYKEGNSPDMVFARWQFNLFQTVLPFSRSDLKRHKKPALSLAFAVAKYEGKYTKFSTSSPSALEGLTVGNDEQYAVEQSMIELAFMYQGFSMQSEYHYKNINNQEDKIKSKLNGFYFDMGYFPSETIAIVPKELEIITRYARVNPDVVTQELDTEEIAFGANWFFYGHRNKLTLDMTRTSNFSEPIKEKTWTMRVQWDVSF